MKRKIWLKPLPNLNAAVAIVTASILLAPAFLSAAPARSGGKGGGPPPNYENVKYGLYEPDLLDFWQARSDRPTPVVVFIHGGGFVAGDKSKGRGTPIQTRCLKEGISYASINYRFRTKGRSDVLLRDCMYDCARAIQFLRSKAKEWNIDKDHFAALGGSAGAGTSLWLAFHDDLADPNNKDPVLRESTRLSVAAATACQATYDIMRWKEFLGEELVTKYSPPSEWPIDYGLKTWDELMGPVGQKLRADCDMLGLISKDDPPVYLVSSAALDGEVQSKAQYLHSPKHARAVKAQCDRIGVEAVLDTVKGARFSEDASSQGMVDFLIKHLAASPR